MDCSAIMLSGGRGQRVGGQDKGRIAWKDSTLAEQVLARIAPQVGDIVISANRNLDWYRALGYPVATDRRADFQGPLAGLEAALPLCHREQVLLVSCDTPELPGHLLPRLAAALLVSGPGARADLCFVNDGKRDHYLLALLHRSLLPDLSRYLDSGGRSVHGWYAGLEATPVDFSDSADAFVNINRPQEPGRIA